MIHTKFLLFFVCFCFVVSTQAQSVNELTRLKIAYPECIQDVSSNYITWKDGSRMPIRGSFPLLDRLLGLIYHVDPFIEGISREDLLEDRYETFFKKMYGDSATEVKKKLVIVYWMPNVFGTRYPLKVTTINGIDQKVRRISAALEKLPRSYYKYLANPAGSFYWRNVARENYLSSHSFGIAIDINSSYANYWLWDVEKSHKRISERAFQNRIPMKIVQIFEKEGFSWGGRWYYYDTMHFEYRPELFVS